MKKNAKSIMHGLTPYFISCVKHQGLAPATYIPVRLGASLSLSLPLAHRRRDVGGFAAGHEFQTSCEEKQGSSLCF